MKDVLYLIIIGVLTVLVIYFGALKKPEVIKEAVYVEKPETVYVASPGRVIVKRDTVVLRDTIRVIKLQRDSSSVSFSFTDTVSEVLKYELYGTYYFDRNRMEVVRTAFWLTPSLSIDIVSYGNSAKINYRFEPKSLNDVFSVDVKYRYEEKIRFYGGAGVYYSGRWLPYGGVSAGWRRFMVDFGAGYNLIFAGLKYNF